MILKAEAQNQAMKRRYIHILLLVILVFLIFGTYFILNLFLNTNNRFKNIEKWKGANVFENTNWNGANNLIYFIQVSDLHFNIYYNHEIQSDFERFCGDLIIKIVKPRAVFVTGDIFDSKLNFFKGSGLNIRECKAYHDVLTRTNVTNHVIWRDLRGNHDASQIESKEQLCYVIGRPSNLNKLGESHQTVIETSFGRYNFLSLDLPPDPGMLLPLNFFGVVSQENIDFIEKHSDVSQYNHTIWLSHYPLSAMKGLKEINFLRSRMNSVISYVFGHYHANKQIYGRDTKTATLLLELGDWRMNRRFRIMVFDNDIFSFRDFYFDRDSEVMILITNPKDYRFNSPSLEPLMRISQSTNIRALIFTNLTIHKITVFINNNIHCFYSHSHQTNGQFESNVFTCPWDPLLLNKNFTHHIKINVLTSDQRIFSYDHQFHLDGKYKETSIFSTFLLMCSIETLIKVIFAVTFTFQIVIPLIIFVFPEYLISNMIEKKFEFLFPSLSMYFLNLNNYYPMLILSILIYIFPMGGMFECFANKFCISTLFGTFLGRKRYNPPVIFIFYIQKIISFDIPMYIYFYFRLKLIEPKHKLKVAKFFYRLLSEIFWIFGFSIACIYSYHRIIPVINWSPLFNLHSYFPVFAIYLRFQSIKYSRPRVKIS